MYPDTRPRLVAARAALILGPVLAGASAILQPDLAGDTTDQLAAIAGSPQAAVSAVAYLVSQLPLLVAILAIGRLVQERAPRLSSWGTALGVAGCFGHTVFGGLSMAYLQMAADAQHRDVYAGLMSGIQRSPVMLFSAVGLLGSVAGLLLLGIALFRSRTGPIWVGPAIWAFLVVEFIGGSLSRYASYLSVLLLAAAFFALAGLVDHVSHRDPVIDRVPV
ncbi:hypothetical protein [Cumulibacter manganitolerans]|uniref:hypothetical protein n=1 Tax=Cumulibacter manganitolerans TaxID=1884992 RepID=UPI00129811E3|nr:hypothetical protein [Cumulibacter manganitolerans]